MSNIRKSIGVTKNLVVGTITTSGYLVDRIDIFCEANEISIQDLVLRCLQKCESDNYF